MKLVKLSTGSYAIRKFSCRKLRYVYQDLQSRGIWWPKDHGNFVFCRGDKDRVSDIFKELTLPDEVVE